VGTAIAAAVAGLVVIVVIAAIVKGAKAKTARNREFLATGIANQPIMPGAPTQATFQTAATVAHAVWLDLELAGGKNVTFELALAVKVGDRMLIEGSYPVAFDDEEHDARGLPNAPGTSALNTVVAATPGATRIKTVLRAYRFDSPAPGTAGHVTATLVPGPGVNVSRAALIVTSPDAPAGSGALPPGMRAVDPADHRGYA